MRSGQNPSVSSTQITTLQALIRRYHVQQKFVIRPLQNHELTFDMTFAVGNDPVMADHLGEFQFDQPIAMVATSGVRAVKLACTLSTANHIPKIFLVDNCLNVHRFWQQLKRIFEKCENEDDFLDQIEKNNKIWKYCRNISRESFLIKRCGDEDYPDQSLDMFFVWLFNDRGFEYIKKIINNTVLIRQNWKDKQTFSKLKNIISYLGIEKTVVYPSNILSTLLPENVEKVRLNIDLLQSDLIIVTDRCKKHGIPHKFGIFVKPEPDDSPDSVHPMQLVIRR